jgi:hypothetical protein
VVYQFCLRLPVTSRAENITDRDGRRSTAGRGSLRKVILADNSTSYPVKEMATGSASVDPVFLLSLATFPSDFL